MTASDKLQKHNLREGRQHPLRPHRSVRRGRARRAGLPLRPAPYPAGRRRFDRRSPTRFRSDQGADGERARPQPRCGRHRHTRLRDRSPRAGVDGVRGRARNTRSRLDRQPANPAAKERRGPVPRESLRCLLGHHGPHALRRQPLRRRPRGHRGHRAAPIASAVIYGASGLLALLLLPHPQAAK
jgi:hypothetical protein